MLMAGLLAANFGWQSVFYVMGAISCVWMFLWVWLVQDKPHLQPLMSMEERVMIESSLGKCDGADIVDTDDDTTVRSSAQSNRKLLPLRQILTSTPFYAILVAHICNNWGWYMLLIELPFYMKQVLKFNIKENALATAFPFLTMWLFSMALSKSLDKLRAAGRITTTTARKMATLFASVIPMTCLLALCFIGCQRGVAVALMGIGKSAIFEFLLITNCVTNSFLIITAITSIGGMFCGFLSNHIDLAPNYAGTLMAITNTAATVPGIIVPIFVGEITHGNVIFFFNIFSSNIAY